jgi:glycosyltransferase involved in cell wall biosynthesis
MKVLFYCDMPFYLAHGGSQTLIEALMRELAALGVEVEPARWWDENQRADIIHTVGRPKHFNVRLAHEKKFKCVMTDLLDQTASRSAARLFLQRSIVRMGTSLAPGMTGRYNWGTYRDIDAAVFAVDHELEVARYLFGLDAAKGHVIPHGLEEEALAQLSAPEPEGDYLVSVATIAERKNTLLLAQAARIAKTPVVFLGKPFSAGDPYFQRFKELVDGEYVRYPGFVSPEEKHRYLRGARGFALLSQFESGCIAVYEAAAAGLPLLLSDLPWAAKSYPQARMLQLAKLESADRVAVALKRFYGQVHRLPGMTFPVLPWHEVARQYVKVYEKVLAG